MAIGVVVGSVVGEAVAGIGCAVGVGEGFNVSEGETIGAAVDGATVDKVVKGTAPGGVWSPVWLQPYSKIIARNNILISLLPESILDILTTCRLNRITQNYLIKFV